MRRVRASLPLRPGHRTLKSSNIYIILLDLLFLMANKELKIDEAKLKKLEEIKAMGINPYPYSFKLNDYARHLKDKYASLAVGEHSKDTASVAIIINTSL